MKSHLYLEEKVENQKRKFAANKHYYPVRVVTEGGEEITGLFTESQIGVAIRRGNRNPEDIPTKSLMEKIFD